MITWTPRAQDIQKPTEEADYHTVSLFERSAFLSDPPHTILQPSRTLKPFG